MANYDKLGDEIFRDYNDDGIPSSGVYNPPKADVRDWFRVTEDSFEAIEGVVGGLNANFVINGDFSVWRTEPGSGVVGTAGGGAPFAPNEIADNWYGGPGPGGQYQFARGVFGNGQTDVAGYPRYYATLTWTVSPTEGSYEYASVERATYLEQNGNDSVESLADTTWVFSFDARVSSGTLSVVPMLWISTATIGWLLGQPKASSGETKYCTNPAGGGLFAYECTGAGTTGQAVLGASAGGSGTVRLQVADTSMMADGGTIVVNSVLGTTEANGTWVADVIDATHVDLVGTTYANAYVSGGLAGYPPQHTAIGTSKSDGGVTWKCIGNAKGRVYDLYESGPLAADGEIYSSTHEGTPHDGAACTVTPTWQRFERVITTPPLGYLNTTDYAGSTDPSRSLLPIVDLREMGGSRPYGGLGFDIVGLPGTVQLNFANVKIERGTQATPFVPPPRRLQELLSLDFGQILSYSFGSIAGAGTGGILCETGLGTFARRQMASSRSDISFGNPKGIGGDITINLSGNLGALASLSTTGVVRRTGPGALSTGGIDTTDFAANVIDIDGTLAANSDTRLASQKAVKAYVDGIVAAQDAMVFKGVIDCSANPNYPAANRGDTYRVSVAGKIGGASGTNVEVGDLIICLTDGTSSGNQATVGTSWGIIQTNLDGAVIGPASATDGGFVKFNGTTGKLVKNSAAQVAVADGGTGAATAGAARANLGIAGVFRATGVDCKNNATTPNSKFDLNANDVILWDTTSAGGTVLAASPGVLTNDITVAGPSANGRDQSGAFSNSSWVHFYWIWNGATLATVSSTVAPPTGPTMPSGYTHWAYAGAVYKNGSGNLVAVRIKGSTVFYDSLQSALSAGSATSETLVGVSAIVPPNALAFTFQAVGVLTTNASGAASENVLIGHVSGSSSAAFGVYTPVASQSASAVGTITLPNVSQQFYYSWSNIAGSANVSARALTVFIASYRVPNGGE